jgi:DNA-binding NarL/FixJ family response regulator
MGSAFPKSGRSAQADIVFATSDNRTIASYVTELEFHIKEEIRLKIALARAEALLREHGIGIVEKPVHVPESPAFVALLTTRQLQIMALVVAGHPSKNIAADLGISQRTVENHRAAIMKKTGAKSLPALGRIGFVRSQVPATAAAARF